MTFASRSELEGGTCGIAEVARELRRAALLIAAVGLLLGDTPVDAERENRRPCGLVGEASSFLVETLRIDLDVNLLFNTAILLAGVADAVCPVVVDS